MSMVDALIAPDARCHITDQDSTCALVVSLVRRWFVAGDAHADHR